MEKSGDSLPNTDAQGHSILSGDWWFIRTQSIPTESGKPIKLAALSEKAGKLCDRQLSLQLAGVSSWLHLLQSPKASNLEITGEDVKELIRRLDIPSGKQWSERSDPHDVKSWTNDFLYKLAILRGTEVPSTDVLDWASFLTWLTLGQGAVSGKTIPLDLLIYSCCAVVLCPPFRPVQQRASFTQTMDAGFRIDASRPDWQKECLRRAAAFRLRPHSVFTQTQLKELEHLIKNEPDEFFQVATQVSDKLRGKFAEWGIRHEQ